MRDPDPRTQFASPTPEVSVLVADQEPSAGEICAILRGAGYDAHAAPHGARVRRLLAELRPPLLLVDPTALDFDLLAELESLDFQPACIELSSFGSAADAAAAIHAGAADFLTKPLYDEQLLAAVRRALDGQLLREENERLRRAVGERFDLAGFATRDAELARVLSTVESLADTRATILIRGESGTGKSLLARTIHQRSTRAAGAFIEVHCGAIPDTLLESELFGHVRGAFTGAVRDKPGKFELAHGGTIFLDEIGTASLDCQVRLLRVLQERSFERVGDEKTRASDARVIAATNSDLEAAVRAGTFREDLLYRLKVIELSIPPLRARRGDIALIAGRALERLAHEHGRPARPISADGLARLVAHDWPGNVRELEHALERAILLARGATLEAADLGLAAVSASAGEGRSGALHGGPADRETTDLVPLAAAGGLKELLEGPEREFIERALVSAAGNRTHAARLLQINRATLFNKMKKYGLSSFPTHAGAPASASRGHAAMRTLGAPHEAQRR